MSTNRKRTWLRWDVLVLVALLLYPVLCGLAGACFPGSARQQIWV